MSTEKKSIKKRKLQASPSSTKLQVGRRLRALRSGQRNLWGDDDSDTELYIQSKKPAVTNKTYVVLSDSDDEKLSSKQTSKNQKSKKKTSHVYDETLPSDNDYKSTSKCVTCLICSILSTLTPYNCCSKHLWLLRHKNNSHADCHKKTTDMNIWPPKQVMIVPMTDDLIQRYINQPEFYHVKTSPKDEKPMRSNRLTRTLSKKSRLTSESSDAENLPICKPKSSRKSPRVECEKPNSSSFIADTSILTSQKTVQDTTFTVVTSSSSSSGTTTNSFESPNLLDTCQLQQSSDQPIIISDSQPDSQQNDSWTPVTEGTYAAMETVNPPVDKSSQDQPEFTPVTARRTPTELMASCLPKIQLKKGRFCQGKPVADKTVPDTTTKECQSSTISTSMVVTNHRAPPALETIVEDESLVIQSTHQPSDKSSQSCHGLSQRHEATTEGLSDTVMSCLFAQEETSDHDHAHATTKMPSNETLPPSAPSIVIEDYSSKLVDLSQLSQLTNDQSDIQILIPSITNEKLPKLAKKSYRMNPDGSRINISRKSASPYHQSPSSLSRRGSNDTPSSTSHTNK